MEEEEIPIELERPPICEVYAPLTLQQMVRREMIERD